MAIKQPARAKPVSVGVRMYNVGLGDSFLLSFRFRTGAKEQTSRILIDCGSTGRNELDGPTLEEVAKEIVKDCGGANAELDALVVTHRHQDHMSGFGGESGFTLTRNLRPRRIIQPWTEDPKADNPETHVPGTGEQARQFVLSLNDAQFMTDSILGEILVRREKGMNRETDGAALFYGQKNLPFADGLTLAKIKQFKDKKAAEGRNDLLTGLNVEALKNIDAITNLQKWRWKSGTATRKPKYHYVQQGDSVELGVPGLSVQILGPVGPTNWEKLESKGQNLKDELWKKLQALRSIDQDSPARADSKYVTFAEERGAYGVPAIFDKAPVVPDSEFRKDSVRWLRERLDLLRGEQLLQFVTALDKHINNTSVVLLLKFGDFRMLFPGDAEVAAWQAIVEDPESAKALEKINLYKVGHHGSNNATPIQSLWDRIIGDRDKDNPLHCVLSTQTTKFVGSIPNRTLMETMLERESLHLVSTAYFDGDLSSHAGDWAVTFGTGPGDKRTVMSYHREFDA